MQNKTVKLLFALAVGAVVATVRPDGALAQTEIIVSGWTPPRHHFTIFLQEEWAEMVERESDGRLRVRYLPRAPMSAGETFDGVRNGLVDVSFITHANHPGRFLLTQMIELPLLANDAETLSVAYQRIFEQHLAVQNEHDGVVPLGMFTPGPTVLMTRGEPLLTPDSLRGEKIRVPGGMSLALVEALGGTPLARPASETYEALSSGVIDAALHPSDVFGGWRLEELVSGVTRLEGGFSNTSFALIMNQAKYDSLSEEDRAALDRASGEAFSRIAGAASDRADARGWEIYAETGGVVADAPPDLVEHVRAAVRPIEEAWADSIDASALEIDPLAILEELRAEIARVAAE